MKLLTSLRHGTLTAHAASSHVTFYVQPGHGEAVSLIDSPGRKARESDWFPIRASIFRCLRFFHPSASKKNLLGRQFDVRRLQSRRLMSSGRGRAECTVFFPRAAVLHSLPLPACTVFFL
jgi:hypothetical protein